MPRSYIGECNPRSKITEETVHQICTLLGMPHLSLGQISIKARTTKNIVREIYKRKTWTYISSSYQFYDRRMSGNNKNPFMRK